MIYAEGMTEIEDAWKANAAINDVLIAHLTPAILEAGTPGGGYTVAQHLAHMVECIKGWASEIDSSRLQNLPDLYSNYDPKTGRFDAEPGPRTDQGRDDPNQGRGARDGARSQGQRPRCRTLRSVNS